MLWILYGFLEKVVKRRFSGTEPGDEGRSFLIHVPVHLIVSSQASQAQ